MSLLWPETATVGLFPGHCWIRRGKQEVVHSFDADQAGHAPDFFKVLGQMLDAPGNLLRKGDRLQLLVSDSIAAVATLPWQEQLLAPQELCANAQACFEQQGMKFAGQWSVHAGFRQYGALGLAHALAQDILDSVVVLAKEKGFRLQRIIPISAAAYWGQRRAPKLTGSLVLLHEAQRVSALIYDGIQLAGFDVEPVIAGNASAGGRLLKRISATHSKIDHINAWSAEGAESFRFEFATKCLPDAKLNILSRNVWN